MNSCEHYDYGKSADKALGAYCTKKKKCVEKEDCEGCKKESQIKKYMLEETFGDKFGG